MTFYGQIYRIALNLFIRRHSLGFYLSFLSTACRLDVFFRVFNQKRTDLRDNNYILYLANLHNTTNDNIPQYNSLSSVVTNTISKFPDYQVVNELKSRPIRRNIQSRLNSLLSIQSTNTSGVDRILEPVSGPRVHFLHVIMHSGLYSLI